MLLQLLILAIIGAFIGWMTNVFAVKLLFRPLKPVRITGFELQGLIPKRRSEIAASIGETVEKELVSINDIMDSFVEDLDKTEIKKIVKDKIEQIIRKKIHRLAPIGLIMGIVNEVVEKQGDELIDEITEKMIHKTTQSIDISQMIEDNINAFDLEKIEAITLELASTELKHIEYLGGLIGFLIGLIQGLIIF